MKEELKFLRRLLAVSSNDRTRPTIYRCATIQDDGRWAVTNGHMALFLTPPDSLAGWRSDLPIPLEPLIDGARLGMLPELVAGLAFPGEALIPLVNCTPTAYSKVLPSTPPRWEIGAWALVRDVRAGIAEYNRAHAPGIAKRHEIRNTKSAKRGYCRPPVTVAKLDRDNRLKIWGNGAWEVHLDLHSSIVEPGGPIQATVRNGTPEGYPSGFNLEYIRALVGTDTGAVLGVRGEHDIASVTLADGLGLVMPHRL